MDKICLHCVVYGLVQGVCYRIATQQKASEVGVTGWVRNQTNGTVEVLLSGTETQVMQLYDWLWQGPVNASVNQIITTKQNYKEFSTFEIYY